MQAPICRACGVRHWGSTHVWPNEKSAGKNTREKVVTIMAPKDEPTDVTPAPAEPVAAVEWYEVVAPAVELPADEPKKRGRPPGTGATKPGIINGISSTDYHREYQRRRREQKRAAEAGKDISATDG